MPQITEELRAELKSPLGEPLSMEQALEKSGKRKIIAVGDVVVLSLLGRGIKPFVSIYDFISMRKPISPQDMKKLEEEYPSPFVAENPAGAISQDLEEKAMLASKSGGAMLINGEEDLATLVFMRISPKGCVIMYGQPNEGVVVVVCGRESKKKADYFFSKMK